MTTHTPKHRVEPTILAHPKTGKPEFAVLPIADYEALLEAAEMAEDVAAFDAGAGDEILPVATSDRLLAGESPLRVFRELRDLTQTQLAAAAGIPQTTISKIETGERIGTVDNLSRLAAALHVDLEDLVPAPAD